MYEPTQIFRSTIPWLMKGRTGFLLFLVAILACFNLNLSAQQLTGSLSGTVFDQAGAIIPGAQVTLTNEASGDERKTVSEGSGFFSITAVQPGTYRLLVSAANFVSWEEKGIVMNLGDSRSVANIKLKVGSASAQVEVVSGSDAVVPFDTGEVSTTINEQMINDITLQGRDAGELMGLMPGMGMNGGLSNKATFNDQTVGSNNGPVGSFSSNGTQPNGSMAYMLDGANLVDPGNAGTQIANINQDMVSQVKVLQSDYDAEYAKGPTIFEAFSKFGGQHFHGEGYTYIRNSELNSFESYAKGQYLSAVAGGTPKAAALLSTNPASHYGYYGGNVGGPVILPFTHFNRSRNKLFFWGGYEYMDQHPATQPVNYNVFTSDQLNGFFAYPTTFPTALTNYPYQDAYTQPKAAVLPANATVDANGNTTIPTSDFDPNIQALLKAGYWPKTNETPNGVNGWSNYVYGNNVPQNRWEATGKVDYAINDNTKVTGSYTRQIENDQHPISVWWASPWTLPYPSPVAAPTVSQEVMVNVTHSFNASTTNEFVYALARYINPSKPSNEEVIDRDKIGFNVPTLFNNGIKQTPNLSGPWGGSLATVTNYTFGGPWDNGAFGGLKKAPAIYDNVTKVIGTHAIKAGFYWDTQENVQSGTGAANGGFTFDNGGNTTLETGNVAADFLLGRPGQYTETNSLPTDDLKYHQWSIYGQDSWKVNKQLTLNYGLRLDHLGMWYGTPAGIQVWNPATYDNTKNAPANTGLAWNKIDKSVPVSGFKSRLFYPEPRVGFAYDVLGTGKTVFRGGIALFRYQISTEVCNNNACDGPQGVFTYGSNLPIAGGLAGISALASTVPATNSQSNYLNGSTLQALQKNDDRTPNTLDWNLTISQALPWHSVFEAAYVANRSRDEIINGANGKYDDLNNIAPGAFFRPDPITGKVLSPAQPSNGFNSADYRPLRNYGDVYLLTHGSFANYNSLQVSWQKQTGKVTFLTNYTFSKVLGIWDGDSSNGSGNGSMVDPFNLKNNYGPLAYDHTNSVNLVYVWKTPNFYHGYRPLGEVINGWEISGVTQFQSGAPLQPNLAGSLNASYPGNLTGGYQLQLPGGLLANAVSPATWFGSSSYNVIVPKVTCDPRKTGSGGKLPSHYYFNPGCFTVPEYGQQGTLEMPYMRGPAYFNSDLALFKDFKVTENQKLQLRFSARNFLNHPLYQFGLASQADESLSFTGTDANGLQYLSDRNTNTATTGKPALTTGQRTLTLTAKYYF
jgi:hypothetical protein